MNKKVDKHKVAVVTGGASGIGFEIVTKFLEDGFRVAFFSSTTDKVIAAETALKQRFDPDRLLAASLDIVDLIALDAFWTRLIETWGGASVLVNNAGISPKRHGMRIPFHNIPIDEWNRVISVNLTGAFRCSQRAIPAMVKRGYGRIAMIGSLAGRAPPRLAGSSYVASKGGLTALVKSIVAEYSSDGITANTVCPGSIATEMMGDPDSKQNAAALARIPIGRLGSGREIAEIVKFLCSSEGAFVTGASIDANGGEYTAP